MHDNLKRLILKSQNGDNKSLEELINLNSGLIWGISRKFWYKEVENEDLYQIGCIGFIKAVRRFDFSYNVELSTYAAEYISGEIKKFIRDDGIIKISRNIKELGSKIKEIQKVYGENIDIKQLANLLEVSEEEIQTAIDALRKVESINGYIYEDQTTEKIEKVMINKNNEEVVVDKILISNLLDNLKLRDREIIRLRYFKEKTQNQVAGVMGISQVQVSRIERKILGQLRQELIKGDVSI